MELKIANIFTAQMLRASESQHKMAGMSLEYSVTGAEDATQMKAQLGETGSPAEGSQ